MVCIVFWGDDEPTDTTEALKDMNMAILLSPTGSVQGVFGMGDMTKSSGTMIHTMNALDASTLKDTPQYFVIGNHEYDSRSTTYPLIQARLKNTYPISKYSGDPTNNTFLVKINGINIWVLNIYSVSSGGAVDQAMFDWLNASTKAESGYKIVIAHDPMYPTAKHIGNSLDADITMRNKLQAMFEANKVNAFIGGHVHVSTVQIIGGVFHICSGVIGPGAPDGTYDSFATINYIFIDGSGQLILQRTQDVDNSWLNAKKLLTIIGTNAGTPTPTPTPTQTPTPNPTPTPTITPTTTPTPNPGQTFLFSFVTFPDGANINITKPTPKPSTPTPVPTITPAPTITPIPGTPTPLITPGPTPTPAPTTIPKMTDLEKIKIDSGHYQVEAEVYNFTSKTRVEFWDGTSFKSASTGGPKFISKVFTIAHTITAKLYEGSTYLESHKENFSP